MGHTYIHTAKSQAPSFQRWAKMNEKVEGINWKEVNSDRRQVGRKPFEEVTKFNQ